MDQLRLRDKLFQHTQSQSPFGLGFTGENGHFLCITLPLSYRCLWKHGTYLPSTPLHQQFPVNAEQITNFHAWFQPLWSHLSLCTSIFYHYTCSRPYTRLQAPRKWEPSLIDCEASQGIKHRVGAQPMENMCLLQPVYEECYWNVTFYCLAVKQLKAKFSTWPWTPTLSFVFQLG